MYKLIIIACCLYFCKAPKTCAVELKNLSLRLESFYTKHDPFLEKYSTYRRPQLPYQQSGQEQWSFSKTLKLDLSLQNYYGETYWHNNVRGASTTSQYRYVGWEFEIGQRFGNFSLFYYHHSEHGLDIGREQYPLEDSFGISFCLAGSQCD